MIIENKPKSPQIGTAYTFSFKDKNDSDLYLQTVELLNSSKQPAHSSLGTLEELSSTGIYKHVKLTLLTNQLVYIRIKNIDYPFRGHETGLSSVEFPRVGQDTYFPLRTLPSVVRIKSVSNGAGCKVFSGAFKSPSYSYGSAGTGGAVRIQVNTLTGHMSFNSFQIVSEIEEAPFYTNIKVSSWFEENQSYPQYRYLKMSFSIPGQGDMYPDSVVIPKLNFAYSIWDEVIGDSVPVQDPPDEYNVVFTREGSTNVYSWRFEEPGDLPITYFEADAVQHPSYMLNTRVVITATGKTLYLRHSDSQKFHGLQPISINYLYSANHAQNDYPLITGAENIVEKSETIYFHAFGVDIAWVSRITGAGTQDLGELCRHAGLNKWAKWKPFRLAKLAAASEADNHFTLHYNIPEGAGADENILSQEWTYLKPQGGPSEPYRLLDFRNYLHTAVVPVEIQFPAHFNVNGVGSSIKLLIKNVDPANINFPPYGAYFGVMLKKGTARQYRTASQAMRVGGLEVSIEGSTLLTSGSSIEVFCFYTDTAIPSFVNSTTAVLKSLNLENDMNNDVIDVV